MPNELGLLQYVPRQQYAMPFDIIGHGVESLKKAHYDALEQRSQLSQAMAALDLNEAENDWKSQYTDRIKAEIDNAAEDGLYATALTRAKSLAGDVASDPALLGRARYQQDFKKFQEQVKGSTDYDQDTKEYTLEKNQYGYQDQTNDAGKVVGGNTFKAAFTPTKSIPIESAMREALQIVAKDAGGSETIYFGNGNGGFTKDYAQSDGVAYMKNGSTFERVTKQKLEAALQSVIANTPGMQASIDQEYKVGVWKTEKQDKGDKKAPVVTDVTDKAGRLLTQDEWFKKRIDPFYKAATYNNVIYKSSAEAGFSASMQRKLNSGDGEGGGSIYTEPMSVIGKPITLYGDNAKSIIDRRTGAEGAIFGMSQKYKVDLKDGMSIKDKFDAIKNSINNSNASSALKQQDLNILSQNYHEFVMTNKITEDYMKDAPVDVRKAVELQSAIANGTDLSQLKDNPFVNDIIKKMNKDFGPDVKRVDVILDSVDGFKAILNELGIRTQQDARRRGFVIIDEKHTICTSNNKAMGMLEISAAFERAIKKGANNIGSRIVKIDSGNNAISGVEALTKDNGRSPLKGYNSVWDWNKSPISTFAGSGTWRTVNKLADSYLNAPPEAIQGNAQVFGQEDMTISAMRNLGIEMGDKSANVKRNMDMQKDEFINVIKGADGSQYRQWVSTDEKGKEAYVEVVDPNARLANYNEAINMYNNDKDNVSIHYRSEPDGSISTELRYAYIKTTGNRSVDWKQYKSIVVPYLVDSPTMEITRGNPRLMAKSQVLKARYSPIKAVSVNTPEVSPLLPSIDIRMSGAGEYFVEQETGGVVRQNAITEDEAITLKAASNRYIDLLNRRVDINNTKDRSMASDAAVDYIKAINGIDPNVTYDMLSDGLKSQAQGLARSIFENR
jgi:hypothetical protein